MPRGGHTAATVEAPVGPSRVSRRVCAGPRRQVDVTGVPGRPHIRLIFGLDMWAAGQSERLRPEGPFGSENHDRATRPGV